jgi:hypothetical protein
MSPRPRKRYFVTENRACGDLILELRDREQEERFTLIAEFYPHGWTNARYEVAALAARLNGETVPTPTSFDNERLADLERRFAELVEAFRVPVREAKTAGGS